MIKSFFILTLLFITGLIPVTTLAETAHTAPFPAAIINVNQDLQATGDGYIPIPYKDRFYYINHHANPNDANNKSFGCIDKNTMTFCTDGWPRELPDGEKTTASPLYSSTSSANEEFVIRNDKLYYPVTRFSDNNNIGSTTTLDWGLGCFDLNSHDECGYVKLSNNPNSRNYRVAIEGPFVIGNKFYLLDLEMKLHCTEFPTSSAILPVPCTKNVLDLSISGNGLGLLPFYEVDRDLLAGHIGGEVGPAGSNFVNNLYLTVNYHGRDLSPPTSYSKKAVCIDTTSMASCSGWPAEASTFDANDRSDNYSNFIQYDTLFNPVSLCNVGTSTVPSCLSLVTGLATTDAAFDAAMPQRTRIGLGGEVMIANKTYFPTWASKGIICYDWASQTSCSGFPPNGFPSKNDENADPQDYALSVDDAGCMWALGHKNQLWSLDPIALVSPCNVGKIPNVVEKSCSSADWLDFDVTGITASDFDSLVVRIKDINGDWITFNLLDPANLPIRLNDTAFSRVNPLEYEVEAAFAKDVTAYTTTPVITITDNFQEGSECIPDPGEPFDFCCTPWTKSALEKSFQIVQQPGGGLTADFTFEYTGNATNDTQIDAYVNYLKTIKPTIDNLSVDFELKDHGSGNLPSSGIGTVITGLIQPGIQTVTWPSGVPATSFWNGFPMKVNHWYGIHSKVKIVNNAGVELNILDQECKDPDLFVRIQVISSGFAIAEDSDSRALDQTSSEILDQAIMQISDGKAIVKSITLN
jgi:hypothetical protein